MSEDMQETQPQTDSTQVQPQPAEPQASSRRPLPAKPLLIFGIGLIFFGILAALDNLGIADLHFVIRLFIPVLLIIMGVFKIRQDGGSGGYALVIAGLFTFMIFFGRNFEAFLGPMILVALGIFVIMRSLNQHRGLSPEQRQSENMLSGSGIFSGFKRRVTSQAFKGGELTAIFGAFDVDFRKAAIQEGTTRLDVFVLFGGGELRVPEDWQVDVQVSAMFGGVEDKTHSFGEQPREGQPRLVVTGLVLFGGLEVIH